MDLRPDDHDHPGGLGHDLPPMCEGGCGWPAPLCHC